MQGTASRISVSLILMILSLGLALASCRHAKACQAESQKSPSSQFDEKETDTSTPLREWSQAKSDFWSELQKTYQLQLAELEQKEADSRQRGDMEATKSAVKLVSAFRDEGVIVNPLQKRDYDLKRSETWKKFAERKKEVVKKLLVEGLDRQAEWVESQSEKFKEVVVLECQIRWDIAVADFRKNMLEIKRGIIESFDELETKAREKGTLADVESIIKARDRFLSSYELPEIMQKESISRKIITAKKVLVQRNEDLARWLLKERFDNAAVRMKQLVEYPLSPSTFDARVPWLVPLLAPEASFGATSIVFIKNNELKQFSIGSEEISTLSKGDSAFNSVKVASDCKKIFFVIGGEPIRVGSLNYDGTDFKIINDSDQFGYSFHQFSVTPDGNRIIVSPHSLNKGNRYPNVGGMVVADRVGNTYESWASKPWYVPDIEIDSLNQKVYFSVWPIIGKQLTKFTGIRKAGFDGSAEAEVFESPHSYRISIDQLSSVIWAVRSGVDSIAEKKIFKLDLKTSELSVFLETENPPADIVYCSSDDSVYWSETLPGGECLFKRKNLVDGEQKELHREKDCSGRFDVIPES